MKFSRKNQKTHKNIRNIVSKGNLNNRYFFLTVIVMFLASLSFSNLSAQEVKKHRVRIRADYVKIMDGKVYFDIKANSRINKRNVNIANIDLRVTNEFDDEEVELGRVTTNMDGESRLNLKSLSAIRPDSTNTYNVAVHFKGNDTLNSISKSINFKDALIEANLITKDSINYISATLKDANSNSVIVGESLDVQIQRLFRPLKIGEEFNNTDENGSIMIPVEEGIPGIDGMRTFEVVLNDSDEYGTVKDLISAPVGIPIVDESTFDDRTMWSPRSKTPLYLLIIPNLLTFGMWVIIVYLIMNLFKIVKS